MEELLSWTGDVVGDMHNYRISNKDLAEELCVTEQYVSMVLNGKKRPVGAKERLEAAVINIIAKRKESNN